jgi:hypothetical protein
MCGLRAKKTRSLFVALLLESAIVNTETENNLNFCLCQGNDGGHTGECAREGRLHSPDGGHQRQRRHYGAPHHGLRMQDQQLQEYHR